MPELPEVQTVVDTLSPLLVGRRLLCVVHLRADIVTPADIDLPAVLANRVVSSITRRGKRIIFQFDDGNCCFVHLGMSGRLTFEPAPAGLRPHTHWIVDCGDGMQLRFVDPRRFGGIFWCGRGAADAAMGPEPLEMRSSHLKIQLSRTKRSIKAALLDQKVIAGIGNIYADEALYAARIHPLTISSKLTDEQAKRLNGEIKRVLRRAIRHRGSSLRDYVDANGDRGNFQSLHRVYDRAGEPCHRCGVPIKRIIVTQRSTCFCPACQKR